MIPQSEREPTVSPTKDTCTHFKLLSYCTSAVLSSCPVFLERCSATRRFTWYAITASASINAATKDPRSAWVSQSVLLMIARRTRINDRASVATRPSSEFSSASARHRTSSVSRNSKSFSRSSSGKWMEWAIRCDARCDAAPSRLLPAPPILPLLNYTG